MKREDLYRVAEGLSEPMKDFIRESRVRTAILVNQAGQVMAEHGFSRGYDAANVAALAAAAYASAHALAELTESGRWLHMHHAGKEKQLFLAPFKAGDQEFILVAIFDEDSTLGLVQLFFDRLAEAIRAMPELQGPVAGGDVEEFERDLEAGVERILETPPEPGGS